MCICCQKYMEDSYKHNSNLCSVSGKNSSVKLIFAIFSNRENFYSDLIHKIMCLGYLPIHHLLLNEFSSPPPPPSEKYTEGKVNHCVYDDKFDISESFRLITTLSLNNYGHFSNNLEMM